MTIYIVLYILTVALCFLEVNSTKIKYSSISIKTKTLAFVFLYSFILIMGILRDKYLGVDVKNYEIYYFNYVQKHSVLELLQQKSDVGYYLLNKVISFFVKDYWIFKGILYTITFSVYSFVMVRRTKIVSVSYLSYLAFAFIGVNFCILRQALAVSICFVAYRYAKERKLIKFLLIVLLAMSFHQTAIFFGLVYPLMNIQFNKKKIWKKILLMVGSLVVFYVFMPVFIQNYVNNDYSSIVVQGEGKTLLIYYLVLMVGLGIAIKSKIGDDEIKKEYDASWGLIYLQIGSLYFSLFNRMTLFYLVLLTVLIPNIISQYKKKNVVLLFFIMFISILFFINLFADTTNIIPYSSIFEG